MNPVLQHLEKLVFGVVVALAAIVVVGHLAGGSTLRGDTARISGDVDALDTALKQTKLPPAKAIGKYPEAAPILAALGTAGATPGRGQAWSFYRRPRLKVTVIEPPDLRKDNLPPQGLTATVADFEVTVSWTPNAKTTAAITNWRIYRFPKGEKQPEKPAAEVAAGTTTWVDPDAAALKPGTTWQYTVSGVTKDVTKQGAPESAVAGPAEAALPYDREIIYYGAATITGKGADRKVFSAILQVRRWHAGAWRGPEQFAVKPGEIIGSPKSIEIDGERVEVDFTTKWTLVDADFKKEVREENGKLIPIDEKWIIVQAKGGQPERIDAVDKPTPAAGPRKPRNPVDAEIQRLLGEKTAARDAGDFDRSRELDSLRKWLSGRKAKYLRGNALRNDRVQADLDELNAEIENADIEIEWGEENKKAAHIRRWAKKKADAEQKAATLKNLLPSKG